MRYVPRLLNQNSMFLCLNTASRDTKGNENLTSKIDHFLYRASCVLKSLESMQAAEALSVNLVKSYIGQIKFGKDLKIAISVEPLFEVYAQIPSALSQQVNMQNQVLPILQSYLGIKASVPSSLKDALKVGIEKYGFSPEISSLINEYWRSIGNFIRDVRDINEHFVALVDFSYFKYEKDPGQILIFLPDNPEEKSPSKFTYKNENDAFETISEGLHQLNNLFEKIFSTLGVKPSQFENSLYMKHMGSLGEEQERTLGLMVNITKYEDSPTGRKLYLDTVEIQQIIPSEPGKGNIAVRKMVPDSEVDESKNIT